MQAGKRGADLLEFFNREARVVHQGTEYRFSEEDFAELDTPSNYWHNRTDPSTWLCAAAVRLARIRFRDGLPRCMLIRLCAETLNITEKKLEGALDWHANYMAWHDGGTVEEYHPYLRDET